MNKPKQKPITNLTSISNRLVIRKPREKAIEYLELQNIKLDGIIELRKKKIIKAIDIAILQATHDCEEKIKVEKNLQLEQFYRNEKLQKENTDLKNEKEEFEQITIKKVAELQKELYALEKKYAMLLDKIKRRK